MSGTSNPKPPVKLAFMTGLLWLGLPLAALVAVPHFEAIFADFGVALPGVTLWLINGVRWLRGVGPGAPIGGMAYAGLLMVAGPYVAVFAVPTLIALEAPRQTWARLVVWLLLLVAASAAIVVLLALLAPYASMVGSIQSGV